MSTCCESSIRSTADSSWGTQQIKHKQENTLESAVERMEDSQQVLMSK